MIDELEKLNKQFFRLYGDLYKNAELMSKEQLDLMQKNLLENYKKEYEILKLQASIEEENKIFDLKTKCDWFIARAWRFLWIKKANAPAKLNFRKIEYNANVLFDDEFDSIEAKEKAYKSLKDNKSGELRAGGGTPQPKLTD